MQERPCRFLPETGYLPDPPGVPPVPPCPDDGLGPPPGPASGPGPGPPFAGTVVVVVDGGGVGCGAGWGAGCAGEEPGAAIGIGDGLSPETAGFVPPELRSNVTRGASADGTIDPPNAIGPMGAAATGGGEATVVRSDASAPAAAAASAAPRCGRAPVGNQKTSATRPTTVRTISVTRRRVLTWSPAVDLVLLVPKGEMRRARRPCLSGISPRGR